MARPAWRRRAAVFVEFALVGPIFIMIMIGIIQVAFWLWNGETLAIAARSAARETVIGTSPTNGDPTSAGVGELSRLLAGKVTVVTPAYKVVVDPVLANDAGGFDLFSNTPGGSCLRQRNTVGPGLYMRLGWDWSCLRFGEYPPDEPLRTTFGDGTALDAADAALRAGMAAGVRQLFGSDGAGNIWIGPHSDVTIEASLVAIGTDGSEQTLYALRGTAGADGRFETGSVQVVSTISDASAIAPLLVRVTMRASAPSFVGIDFLGPLGIALEGNGSSWIDRYRPTCPPPMYGFDYAIGACGGIH